MANWFMGSLGLGIIFTGLLFFLGFYIYGALALMTIAKRTKTENAWLAWIPIANIYLMMRIGKLPTWTLALWALIFVPMLGGIASAGMAVWYWWAIAEQRGKEGWWGILMLVPIVNLVMVGILAWGEDDKKSVAPAAKKDPVKQKVVTKKSPTKKVVAKKAPTKKKVVKKKK